VFFYTVKIRIDRTVHYTDVVRPLQVALLEIQRDANEAKIESMKLKIDFLSDQANLLNTEITENSLGAIFKEYRKINQQDQPKPDPDATGQRR
jgi:hypothetical protein